MFYFNSLQCDKHTNASLFATIKQIKGGFCVDRCDFGPVSVYPSVLLGCALQVQQEQWKRVTQICSNVFCLQLGMIFKPRSNPVFTVTTGFSALQRGCSGLQEIGRVSSDTRHILVQLVRSFRIIFSLIKCITL